MSGKDSHLYRPAAGTAHTPSRHTPSNPHDTTFSSAFSSLLASSSTGPSKPRTSVRKDTIFSTSNQGAKKRAAADMLAPASNATARTSNGENLDEAEWRCAKRKMDEKARLYAALKRGDVEDKDERYGVDFDRKWAARESREADSEQSDSDDDAESEGGETIEYIDDMGRTRTGSRKEVLAEERRRARQKRAEEAEGEDSARPLAPDGVIYGDAVQSQAFDLDSGIGTRMEDLAKKRDREETPPPDEHYDASKDIRTKGTGFYQFSQDKETREQQMRDLEQMRTQTEQVRGEKVTERDLEKARKKAELEERRRVIREKKGKVMADRFLSGLEDELAASIGTSKANVESSDALKDE